MALARVVTFEGVDTNRVAELKREMASTPPPEGLPATEFIMLHDADANRSIVIMFFDNDDDYRQGDAMLNAMPTGDTPGTRAAVTKCDVAIRMTV